MNVHVIQTGCAGADPVPERARIAAAVAMVDARAGDLLILPELASTSYRRDLQEDAGAVGRLEGNLHGDLAFYGELARHHRVHLLAGCLDTSLGKGQWRNLAVAFGPDGKDVFRYGKIHPFSFSGEDRAFSAGDAVPLWHLEGWVIQPVICYDLRFPELFRWQLNRGVNAFAVIANWPAARSHQWRALLTARAIENQAFVFAANAGGETFGIPWAGGSGIIHPKGEWLAECRAEPSHVSAEVDVRDVSRWREAFPVLRDRKPSRFYLDGGAP